jgi:hypothetical protein
MAKNTIYLEDCRKTLDRRGLKYDYVWTGIPDYAEIGLKPLKDDDEYIEFVTSIPSKLKPKNDLITLFGTDRKFGGGIIPRHMMMAKIMEGLGHKMRSHKIWVKTEKIDLFRLTYAHIITYGSGKMENVKIFKHDVFTDTPEKDKNAQPSSLIEKCILNHTKPGEVVYDPCIGLGNMAVAALNTKRSFIGSEIEAKKHAECVARLKGLGAKVKT